MLLCRRRLRPGRPIRHELLFLFLLVTTEVISYSLLEARLKREALIRRLMILAWDIARGLQGLVAVIQLLLN